MVQRKLARRSRPTRLIAVGGIAGALLLSGCAGQAESPDQTALVMASWGGGYQDATETNLVAPWAEETGTEVTMVSAPGTQVAGLESQRNANNPEWDVIDTLPAQDSAFAYEAGLLAKLPDDVKAELESVLVPGAVTDFGFASGTLGQIIVCNRELVEACPQNAAEFFDVEAFPGTRTIPNQPLEGFTIAALAGGADPATSGEDDIDIDAALAQLDALRDSVSVFWDSGDQMEQVMLNGEAAMGILYSGRVVKLIEGGLDLEMVWNDGLYNPGYFVVAEDSENKEAAFDLLLSIANNVEGLAAWADEMNYSVSNPEALALVDPDLQQFLADNHVDVMARQNLSWYAENKSAVDDAWREYVSG